MNVDSPFVLWIPSSLEEPSVQEFLQKQHTLTHAIRKGIVSNIELWECLEMLEEVYTNIEIDDFLDRLKSSADNHGYVD